MGNWTHSHHFIFIASTWERKAILKEIQEKCFSWYCKSYDLISATIRAVVNRISSHYWCTSCNHCTFSCNLWARYVQRNFLSYFPIENDLNWRGFANSYQMNDNREVYCTIFLSFLSPSGMQPTISLMKRIDWGFPPHLNIVLAILFKIESWREKNNLFCIH